VAVCDRICDRGRGRFTPRVPRLAPAPALLSPLFPGSLDVGGKLLTGFLKEGLSYRQFNMMDDTLLVNRVGPPDGRRVPLPPLSVLP
jgi:hypothetical protein